MDREPNVVRRILMSGLLFFRGVVDKIAILNVDNRIEDQPTVENGRAFSATGQKTCEREKLQLKHEKEKLSGLLENQRHQNQLRGKKILEYKDAIENLDRDNKELQYHNQQLMLKKEKLSGLLENQRHQNQLRGKKILEYKDAIERLDGDNKELQYHNQQLMFKTGLFDLRKRTADSEERVTSALKTIRGLEWEKRTMEAKIKEQNEQIQELFAICQKTAHENVALRSKTERGSSAERELSSFKQEIKKLQKQQSILTLERDSLKSEKEKLSGLLENQRHQNQLHGKKILEYKDAIERLDRDNQELQNQNQQLMLKSDSNTQEYQQTSAAAKGKIDMLQKEISDSRKRTADSEERVESASKTIHELEWEKRTMEAKIKELNKQIQELNARQDSQRQEYQKNCAAAAKENERLQREITDLRNHKKDSELTVKSTLERVEVVEGEKAQLKAEIQRQADQIQDLKTQQESYEKMYQQMAAGEEEKETLQREITDLRKHRADSVVTSKSLSERVQRAEREKASLEAVTQRYKDQIQELTKRCEEIEQVLHDVRHTLKQNEEIMEKCSSRNHEHDETVHALRMQSEETEKERNKPQEEQDELFLRHAQVVMDISPREMAMRLGEVYRKINEMLKRDKSQTDKKDADEEDLSILSDLKELLQKYYTLMEKKYQNNEVINDVLDQEFLEILPAVRNKFQMFSQSFFEICRDMFSLTPPPPRLEFGDGMRGSTINRELFNCYKKPGEVVDYVIWPALVSRCDGSVFEKGIVKPQVLTK